MNKHSQIFEQASQLHQKGHLQKAKELYQQYLASTSDSPIAYNQLGCIYQSEGNYEQAFHCFQKALSLDSQLVDAHINLGNNLQNTGRAAISLKSYRKALQIDPENPIAYVNLGNAYRELNENEHALTCYYKASTINPQSAECFFNISATLVSMGKRESACSYCEKALTIDPENTIIKRLMKALKGENETHNSDQDVKDLFNKNAAVFEDRLKHIQYQAPQALFQALQNFLPKHPLHIVDLGCGTGLCGIPFQKISKSLIGIDLSPCMLQKAKEKKIYDQLIEGEISNVLGQIKQPTFDLGICTDVFIYMGNIDPFFSSLYPCLKANGLLGISIEKTDQGNSELLVSGRFAQSPTYVKNIAKKHNFLPIHEKEFALRKESGTEVLGQLLLFQKTDKSQLVAL